MDQCTAKDTLYINYGYNPEIKGGGKDTDVNPLAAAGGGASIGESGHVMVGSEPTVVTLGAVYKRPVVIAGVPSYPKACRVGSEAQTTGAECDEVVPRVNIEMYNDSNEGLGGTVQKQLEPNRTCTVWSCGRDGDFYCSP